jgi:hypothetical protein
MHKLLSLLFLLAFSSAIAQSSLQSVRGIVKDKQSNLSLPGATVLLKIGTGQTATITDGNGKFLLENIPVGRHQLEVSFIGYEPLMTESFLLQSTKESFLEISLTEGYITADEVVVTANKNAFEPLNELSAVSTRSFTAEETERIPAGINDPARVVLSYPGVQISADDNENQIVVRGNSPVGILWRLV